MRTMMKLGIALILTALIFALASLDQAHMLSIRDMEIGFFPVFLISLLIGHRFVRDVKVTV
jgi:hypothetical protein